MPVEERLRTTLDNLADQVMADAEHPLAEVRRRHQRRVRTLWAGAGAAVVVLVTVAGTLVPQAQQRPEPTGPPAGERTDAPQRTIPLATYTRIVTDDEVLDAGFPRWALADLFGGAGQARVELVFRNRTNRVSEQEGWTLRFVDAQGKRRMCDRGFYFYGDGERYDATALVLLSTGGGVGDTGFHYALSWELKAGSLVLEPTPKNPARPTAALLGAELPIDFDGVKIPMPFDMRASERDLSTSSEATAIQRATTSVAPRMSTNDSGGTTRGRAAIQSNTDRGRSSSRWNFRVKQEAARFERYLKSGSGRAFAKRHFDPGMK